MTSRAAPDVADVADTLGGTDAGTEPVDRLTRLLHAVREVKLLWTDVSRSSFPSGASGLGVLHLLEQRGPQRISDLATCAHVGVSTMSRHVADLAAAGLLDRELDPADGRTHRVRLSVAGSTELGQARAAVLERLTPALDSWTELELDALGAALTRLATDLAAALGRTPERT